jgi:hypothetical protein
MKKIAITKDNKYDILRIIPFNETDDGCDFKLETFLTNTVLNYYKLNKIIPIIDNSKNNYLSFSYHKKTHDKPTKIHIKKNNHTYKTILQTNLIDPTDNIDFPFPLLKIGISNKSTNKSYRQKTSHNTLDIKSFNTIEIYLSNKYFNPLTFIDKLKHMSLIHSYAPIEYFSSGKLRHNNFKHLSLTGACPDIHLQKCITSIANIFNITFSLYLDPSIINSSYSYISFFENSEYLKYLFCAPIAFKHTDGFYSQTKTAFELDTIANNDVTSSPLLKYHNAFLNHKLELLNNNQLLDAFCLPIPHKFYHK